MMVAVIAEEEHAGLDAPRHRGSLSGRHSHNVVYEISNMFLNHGGV